MNLSLRPPGNRASIPKRLVYKAAARPVRLPGAYEVEPLEQEQTRSRDGPSGQRRASPVC